MSEIEFLRRLGDDLRQAARRENTGPASDRGILRRRLGSRKLVAVSTVLVLVLTAPVVWTVTHDTSPSSVTGNSGPTGGAANPRIGGAGINYRRSGTDLWAVDASSP